MFVYVFMNTHLYVCEQLCIYMCLCVHIYIYTHIGDK
jgi:hypothetical protein